MTDEKKKDEFAGKVPASQESTKSQLNTDKVTRDSKTTIVGPSSNAQDVNTANQNQQNVSESLRTNQDRILTGTSSPGLQKDLMQRANTARPVLTIEHYSANKRALVEKILRDKGMDTMQVVQALGMIESILFEELPSPDVVKKSEPSKL